MVTLDENTKARLSKLTDPDGKIVITDDMPEDLQECIKFLNDNNVSLTSGSDPEAYMDDEEADPFAPGYVDSIADSADSVDDDSDDVADDSDDVADDSDDDDEELDEEDVAELDDVF